MRNTTDNRNLTLADLDDWQLENSDQDLRGRPLMTHAGETIGTVRRMLVDCDQERVSALVLDDGRAVAVEDIEIRNGNAYIDEARDLPKGAMIPDQREGEQVVPIVEEELVVGKRAVDRGTIRVSTRTVDVPVREQVRLREEHVDIERRAVNERVDDPDRLFADKSFEVSATSEEAVIGKTARVTEEVVVSKDVGERVEQIDETVRRTEVDIDRVDGDRNRR